MLPIDPLKDIVGTKSSKLNGRRIALCVTGSVAAIESPEIARELMRHGAEVYPVMTQAAQGLIHQNLMEWATGNPPVVELTGRVEHLRLAGSWPGRVDLVLIAPSTANTICKIASGVNDTPVTTVVTCALGSKIPLMIAPAMHEQMYRNDFVAEGISKLKANGVEFIEPVFREGKAKMAPVDEIVESVLSKLSKKDLNGLKILVTAGPTREYLDPVRVITNKSSGKMGVALASESAFRGGEVTLIYGPGSARPPRTAKLVKVDTTTEMYDAVHSALTSSPFGLVIAAGAPADFTPSVTPDYKLPSRGAGEYNVKLKATPKIIDMVRETQPSVFIVAFKAEYHVDEDRVQRSAEALFKEAEANMVVVNDISRDDAGFESESNEVYVVRKPNKVARIPLASKTEVASQILDIVLAALSERTSYNSG